jgi:hypothetical protein
MATIEKNIDNIARIWETKIQRNTLNELREPFERATHMFNIKLTELGQKQRNEKINAKLPLRTLIVDDPSIYGHETKSRLSIDLELGYEIDKYPGKYLSVINDAISGMRMSADAQMWNPATFDKMMSAIDKDAELHTKEIKKLVENTTDSFNNAASYNDVLAFATQLNGTLRDILKEMAPHLEEIARHEKDEVELRK